MIRNVLFDIGVVLLHIDYASGLRRILPKCDPARIPALARVLTLEGRDPRVAEYERGAMSNRAFFEYVAGQSGYTGTYDEFVAAWRGTLSRNEPMLAFAERLSKTHDLFLVTNTGNVQIERIHELLPSMACFKDMATSCALGAVKPERAFYEKALRQFGLRADDGLLVDDRPENVRGARDFGLQALLYTSAEQAIAALREALGLGAA